MGETFWGVPCLSGDDKRLTTLILERRPPDLHAAHRAGLVDVPGQPAGRSSSSGCAGRATPGGRTCGRCRAGWVWRHPFLAFTMIDKAVSSFTLLLGPIFMAWR